MHFEFIQCCTQHSHAKSAAPRPDSQWQGAPRIAAAGPQRLVKHTARRGTLRGGGGVRDAESLCPVLLGKTVRACACVGQGASLAHGSGRGRRGDNRWDTGTRLGCHLLPPELRELQPREDVRAPTLRLASGRQRRRAEVVRAHEDPRLHAEHGLCAVLVQRACARSVARTRKRAERGGSFDLQGLLRLSNVPLAPVATLEHARSHTRETWKSRTTERLPGGRGR